MSNINRTIRIGTRGSPLALKQTETVCALLAGAFPALHIEKVVITTSGDWRPEQGDVRLSESEGGKGQFAKEIEQALLAGEIDAAVHSMKDMDSVLPEGLMIDHMLEREDPRDALLLAPSIKLKAENSQKNGTVFDALPQGAVVGTASVRRAAFLLAERPDLNIVPFRGNVQTRIDKLADENADPKVACTLLAMAGMNRLGVAAHADVVLAPEVMLPAAGQGAVGIEVREGDQDIIAVFSQISCFKTVLCVKAEREVLRVLDGSCHTPIGCYAVLEDGEMWLRVRVCSLDGTQCVGDEVRAPVEGIEGAQELGRKMGMRIKEKMPLEILQG